MMRMALGCLFVACLVAGQFGTAAAVDDGCRLVPYFDYPGNDIKGLGPIVNSAYACAELCAQTSSLVATQNCIGFVHSPAKECWVKHSLTGPRVDTTRVAGMTGTLE